MKTHREKWYESMVRKHGSEAAVKEIMRGIGSKSTRNQSGLGGFAYLKKTNPDKLKEIASLGGKSKSAKNSVKS